MANQRPWQGFSARAALLRPAWWLALGLLLLNDHYLKGAGVLTPLATGKLSDFAGLLMAPAVVAAALCPRSRLGFGLSHLAVGGVFAAIKLSPACAAAWCGLGAACGLSWRVVSDPSDLLALPMLGLSYWLFGARTVATAALAGWRQLATVAGRGIGLVAIVATSRGRPMPPVLAPPTERSVYVGVGDGWKELDRSDGRIVRSIGCGWVNDPHILNGVLYGSGSALRACALDTGRTLWERDLLNLEIAHVDSQRLVAHTRSRVWVLSAQTGATLWERALENVGVFVLGERVMVHDTNRVLEFLALSDGQRVGRRGQLAPRPIVYDGKFYGFQGSELVVLDSAGGALQRAQPNLQSPKWAASSFPGDVLLALSPPNDGKVERESALVALSAQSLEERWRIANAQLLGMTKRFVFTHAGMTCNSNSLTARDAGSGRSLWSIAWCPWDDAMAVDDTLLVWSSFEPGGKRVVGRDPQTGRWLWYTDLDD